MCKGYSAKYMVTLSYHLKAKHNVENSHAKAREIFMKTRNKFNRHPTYFLPPKSTKGKKIIKKVKCNLCDQFVPKPNKGVPMNHHSGMECRKYYSLCGFFK